MAFNMDPKKCPMPAQDPQVRRHNFDEVALGYTAEMAVNEAKRCIHCKNRPCVEGCPVGIKIPEFIATSRWASAAWSALWPTGTGKTSMPAPPCPPSTGTRWPSSARALPA